MTLRGIFYNSEKSQCSIYESGIMCFNALKSSPEYTLTYSEGTEILDSDFIIVNYHHITCRWMTQEIVEAYGKPVFTIVTEVALSGNPIEGIPPYFTQYIVLDPTIPETDRVHGFGRPLNHIPLTPHTPSLPTIGMFGFGTPGKRWVDCIQTVNNEFDTARIRINIPHGTHVPHYITNGAYDEIRTASLSVKPGIQVELTHHYYSDTELVQWCSENTINCFFYVRDHMYHSGLAAVTDQAILAGKPILVTTDKTFRHLHRYISAYPTIGIRTAIETTQPGVLRMREDWSAENFRLKFERILQALTRQKV